MRVSPFISGIAIGAVAGAVVSMVAGGRDDEPSVRRSAQHAATRPSMQCTRRRRGRRHMIGWGGAGEESALSPPRRFFRQGTAASPSLDKRALLPIMVTSSKGSRISSAVNIRPDFRSGGGRHGRHKIFE